MCIKIQNIIRLYYNFQNHETKFRKSHACCVNETGCQGNEHTRSPAVMGTELKHGILEEELEDTEDLLDGGDEEPFVEALDDTSSSLGGALTSRVTSLRTGEAAGRGFSSSFL